MIIVNAPQKILRSETVTQFWSYTPKIGTHIVSFWTTGKESPEEVEAPQCFIGFTGVLEIITANCMEWSCLLWRKQQYPSTQVGSNRCWMMLGFSCFLQYLPKGPQSHASWCNLEGLEGSLTLPWLEHLPWKIIASRCGFNFQISSSNSQLCEFFWSESPKFQKFHRDSTLGNLDSPVVKSRALKAKSFQRRRVGSSETKNWQFCWGWTHGCCFLVEHDLTIWSI